MEKVTHLYRADASQSSRIKAQLAIDNGLVIDNLLLLDCSAMLRLLKKSSDGDVLVFHQQRCLINLFFLLIINSVYNKIKLKIVFDIHDILEFDKASSVRSKFYFFVFFIAEKIVFKTKVDFLTVSNGLARIYYMRYKKSVKVFYNIPDLGEGVRNLKKCYDVVYFGQINSKRLPLELLNYLKINNINIDVYGTFNKDLSFKKVFDSYESAGVLKYKGEYNPDSVVSIISKYKFSLLYFPDDKINLRFCLPNKLFQSLVAGTKCIISNNLSEVKIKFSSSGMLEFLNDTSLNSFENYETKRSIDKVYSMKTQSKITYLSLIC